jgi:hypothetical protein
MLDLDAVPLWLVFVLGVVLIFAASELGRILKRRSAAEADGGTDTLENAMLGLLALLVGFSFAIALSHFDARRGALLSEANAIHATALRARLLPAPHGSESVTLLQEYTRLRLEAARTARNAADLASFVDRSNAVQDRLWQHAGAVAAMEPAPTVASLFVESLNEMVSNQQDRVTAFRARIPGLVLAVLYAIAIFGAGLTGYANGRQSRRSCLPIYAVSIVFVVVILLVQDLDRPDAGLIRVDQQPLIDVAARLAGYAR